MKPKANNPFLDPGKSIFEVLADWPDAPKPVDVKLPKPLPLAIYQFKITLRSVVPAVWRRVQAPNDLTLHQLHRVIQCAFRWQDYHLHHFEIQGARYGIPDPEMHDILNDKRRRICDFATRKGMKWLYVYDYGDDWEHVLTLEKILPWQENFIPVCLKGARACPKEDSGGPWGYAEKLRMMRDPMQDEHTRICDWMGRDWDPERFEFKLTNLSLKREFIRQRGPRRRKGS